MYKAKNQQLKQIKYFRSIAQASAFFAKLEKIDYIEMRNNRITETYSAKGWVLSTKSGI
jgi:hypothetical protein